MRFNKATIALRGLMNEADDLPMGSGGSALSVEDRIHQALYTEEHGGSDNEAEVDDDAAFDDDLQDGLSDDDDAEAEEDADVEESEFEEDEDDTLASVLGLDDDKLGYDEEGNVVFNAVVDGKMQPVSVSEMVKSYQLSQHVNNKSIELSNERKEFEQTRDEAYAALTTRLEGANNLIAHAEKTLMSEFEQIDWNSLRATDPSEWAALRQDFQERASQIEQMKNLTNQAGEEIDAEKQAEQQAKHAQFMQEEMNKMVIDNPTWSDQTVMVKEMGEIGAFLNETYGFSPEEVAGVLDSRLLRLIQDARSHKSGKKAVVEKRIKKNVPKFRKPGGHDEGRAERNKAQRVKQQRQRIRKTGGKTNDIAALIADRM